ncbi:MAG: hypothetical protein QOE70_1334 [Chthoniobacter sp.]|jgi:hypothetical protein|nr:hypothetical protein [Chthoniobacter sp.]
MKMSALLRFVWSLSFLPLAAQTWAEPVQLASDGAARMAVVVAENAGVQTRQTAARLADYLGRIADTKFDVTSGDGATGIAVGLAGDFPKLEAGARWNAKDLAQREDYLLRSHVRGLQVIGATELGVEHAGWDLLYRLGHRQFFPGERWEVIPKARDLRLEVDAQEHPAFLSRRIWYGFGGWDFSEQPYKEWCARNRAVAGVALNTGHSYDGILHRNKPAFAAHPEYLAVVGGVRKGAKFCISNPDLRKLVIEDALRQFEKNPDADSISMDPSDGGGWCECAECAKLGSITDQALRLANEVAAAVNEKHPGKLVGMYAYNYHSPPPNLRVHPQVVISVATAFVKGGASLDELLDGWSAKGARLGIREYYSVNTWDRDLPAQARGGNLAYLRRTIPHFYEKGARFLSAESSDNWGANGLGYYLAARTLWDVHAEEHVDELVEDFLTRAFGPAREPMREFYRQLDGSRPHPVVSDQLGRMFRALDRARQIEAPPQVRARLDDLVLYTRYADLFQRYSQAKEAARQTAFEALIRNAYRMRKTLLVHSKALYRDLANRDKSVSIPEGAAWNEPDAKNPWKSSEPFSSDDLARFLAEGIERHPLTELAFQPAEFSSDLVSAAPLKLPDVAPGALGAGRGKQIFYTRVEQAPAAIELQITGGLIAHYRDRGNVRVELWKLGGASETGERETLVAEDRSVPPDGHEHTVAVPVQTPGVYKVALDDGKDRTLVKLASPLPWTIKSSESEPMSAFYTEPWSLCFYVPRGTKLIGLFGGEHGEVRDSAGRPVFSLNERNPNYYSVPVPEGEDGKLWHIRDGRGSIRLLTVPPYLARTAAELLLPVEVARGR